MKTFNELYDYCQNAERDSVGMAFPFAGKKNVAYHIYALKQEMNICINDMPVAKFIFYPDNNVVVMYPVDEKGVVNYEESPCRRNMSSTIDGTGWEAFVDPRHLGIKEILRDHVV